MTTATAMASTVSASQYSAPPCAIARQTVYAVASSSSGIVSWPRTSRITFNLCSFSSWSGLKHHGLSRTAKSTQSDRKKRRNRMVIKASLFGVGAPEALVIGVVALLVFGPKGLAEVSYSLPGSSESREDSASISTHNQGDSGSVKGIQEHPRTRDWSRRNSKPKQFNVNKSSPTSFPPTISSDQEPQASVEPTADGVPSLNQAVSSEELLKITEEQLKAAATQQPQQLGEVAVSRETSTESPIDETRPKSETGS